MSRHPAYPDLQEALERSERLLSVLDDAEETEIRRLVAERGAALARAHALLDDPEALGPEEQTLVEALRECERRLVEAAQQRKGEILEALAALRNHHHPPHRDRLTEPTLLNCRV